MNKEGRLDMTADLARGKIDINSIDLSKLDTVTKSRVKQLMQEIRVRKRDFPILSFEAQPHQQDVVDAVKLRNEDGHPQYKYIMFIAGNGAGKTLASVYIDILLVMGKELCQKYNLPYIGEARQLIVATKTSSNITTNLEPYFLGQGDDDIIKIPKVEIKTVKRDASTRALKEIILKNGNAILFRTYDAGQARNEGSNPDFIHLDELPEREDIFIELLRGTRGIDTQMLMSFTPTKFNHAVHNFFYGEQSENVKNKTFIKQADSFENKIGTDHTWLEALSEEEQKIRRFGMFVPPTGLVYKEFMRNRNSLPFFHPRELGKGTKYYGALDFGVNHPMAMLFIAVDGDGHIYVFDMIYQRNMTLGQLKTSILQKTQEYGITLEYIVADTADARARLELKEVHGINTIPADKFSKGENNLSNRRAGIFKINGLFKDMMLIISDKCNDLIKELEVHAYKGNGSEEVIKTDDDALDALRYFIFGYKAPNSVEKYRRQSRKVKRIKTKKY